MKRFQFSLEAVHNVREMQRDAAERALAAENADLQAAQLRLDQLICQRQSAMANYLLLHQSTEIEVAHFASHTDFLGSLAMLERQARIKILQVEERITLKRQALTEASRQTKTTSNIRDRQRERYHQEIAQHEQKALDEMAVVAIARRLATGGPM
jgi:flagellar export protein FliJ